MYFLNRSKQISNILFLLFVSILPSCAGVQKKEVPDKVEFFKVVRKKGLPEQVAAEFWQDTKNCTYLYADLFLKQKRTEVVQFVFFNPDFTVNHTEHNLLYQKNRIIAGGTSVTPEAVQLKDYYLGLSRNVSLPFNGKILHPTKLVEYLVQHKNISESQNFGFVDWRAASPAIDEFTIKQITDKTFELQLKNKNLVVIELEQNSFKNLSITFNNDTENLTSDMTLISKSEFNSRSISSFDETQKYLELLKEPSPHDP